MNRIADPTPTPQNKSNPSTLERLTQTARKLQRGRRKRTVPQRMTTAADSTPETPAKPAVRVNGPYANRGKWRLVIKSDGERKSLCFDSREAAEEAKDRLLAEETNRQGYTVGDLMGKYRQYMIETRGCKPVTADHAVWGIQELLPPATPIASLTTERVRAFYHVLSRSTSRKTGRPLSAATHQLFLGYAKGFAKWAVQAKFLDRDPVAPVERMGKRSAGKLQHTIDEAQRFNAAALARARQGDQKALGVLLMLHLGMRQGEVAARCVRDLDEGGAALWITGGKTRNAKRRLVVPAFLRPLLLQRAQGKQSDNLLFGEDHKPPHHAFFWFRVKMICQEAGVPMVCPHSLRGLHASLALQAGATAENVARALGHGSFEITARHYATPDSVLANRQQRFAEVLGRDPRERMATLLSSLTLEETAELKRQLSII